MVYVGLSILGFVSIVVVCLVVNKVIEEIRSTRISPEYRAKVFKKIGKLYDKVGMTLCTWDVFAVEIVGATLDNDANAKNIKGGEARHFTVKARTLDLAKATFLSDHYFWYIVDCNKIKVSKLEYA